MLGCRPETHLPISSPSSARTAKYFCASRSDDVSASASKDLSSSDLANGCASAICRVSGMRQSWFLKSCCGWSHALGQRRLIKEVVFRSLLSLKRLGTPASWFSFSTFFSFHSGPRRSSIASSLPLRESLFQSRPTDQPPAD